MIFPAWMGVAIFARFATNCGLALREIVRGGSGRKAR